MHIVTLTTGIITIQVVQCLVTSEGMLFPRASETRETLPLDGIWNFVQPPKNDLLIGFRQHWYEDALSMIEDVEIHLMPVPSSYNDITTSATIRDHVGVVWYDRTFFVPKSWANTSRVVVRFSSVSYAAEIWINGKFATNHEIGHLPFEKDISFLLNYGENNRITVACDNTLLSNTVPQGSVTEENTDDGRKLVQHYDFDFFNYAGIHRPVTLYTTPKTYIDDITIRTDISGSTGIIYFNISYVNETDVNCIVTILDKAGKKIAATNSDTQNVIKIRSAKFWWPYLMDPFPGYLYTLKVELKNSDDDLIDVYRQPVGIRRITWTNTSMLINGRPLYLHGFGRHEDADIRGKGLDLPTIIKDHNLIKWVGGNVYRTSHYPYADEIMDLADQLGIMIIDECPSVDTDGFSIELLEKHKISLTELIRRDKNRPAVIMWSIANEPRSQYLSADAYFERVAEHVRSLDDTRPVTISINRNANEDRSGQYLDIISFNAYNAWYQNSGDLDMITTNVVREATAWHEKHNKPVLISEYGAGTISGLHIYPQFVWSEEFQVSLMSKHFKAFDKLREQGWFLGEFIWNFADFKTAQSFTRVGGNKKGIFTRDRQPKASAHHLRRRYFLLARELYNVTLPDDLFEYLMPSTVV